MSVTIHCGNSRHGQCPGTGYVAYLIPQDSHWPPDPPFNCGCPCHHDGRGVPCTEPDCVERRGDEEITIDLRDAAGPR